MPYTGLCFTANEAGSTVELCKVGSPSIANTSYSRDGSSWVSFTPENYDSSTGTNTVTLANIGDKVYFRNDITGNFNSADYLDFKMSGSISASGNCNSMYSTSSFKTLTTLVYQCCYYRLFYGCASLSAAPKLHATTLSYFCYSAMFYDCTSLTTTPTLSATTITQGCYCDMFQGCTSLTIINPLPATTAPHYCYWGMFSRCTSLVSPPKLPATTLGVNCYFFMFKDCTSLRTAPVLPATTLRDLCYEAMFEGCTSLTSAPALPAITLADRCYENMFNGCTSLTAVPALLVTTLNQACYTSMFAGCTSLQVSDTQTADAPYAWKIPNTGTFTNTTTYNQGDMFLNCLGTRSSDTMSGAYGESHIYYTQNPPGIQTVKLLKSNEKLLKVNNKLLKL